MAHAIHDQIPKVVMRPQSPNANVCYRADLAEWVRDIPNEGVSRCPADSAGHAKLLDRFRRARVDAGARMQKQKSTNVARVSDNLSATCSSNATANY
jgi:DNA polymerase elongation subunit (family B)